MLKQPGWLVVVGLVALPLAARAEDAYTIKFKEAAKGIVRTVSKQETEKSKNKISNGDMVLKEEDKNRGAHYAYTETVLEKAAGDKKPSKVKREYTKAVTTDGKNETKLAFEGKTVIIEKKEGKYTFTIEGGAELSAADAAPLAKEFGDNKDDDVQKFLAPAKAVKLNESWALPKEVFLKDLEKNSKMTLDAEKATMSGKLVKAYKQGDAQYGVIEYDISIPLKTIGEGAQKLEVDGTVMKVKFHFDGCIDGSLASGTMKSTMAMDFKTKVKGGGMEFDVEGAVNAVNEQISKELPKK